MLDLKLPAKRVNDFLSPDVVGLDLDVSKSINFEKYMPRVIHVEILGATLSEIGSADIYKYLAASI